jgi:hypothetical protein
MGQALSPLALLGMLRFWLLAVAQAVAVVVVLVVAVLVVCMEI